ncbi:hypothetical protein IWW36_005353 [Coemansia brasiliensis]|uniref:NADP-dependent oxidoreductase domain-containing protein n=1 Tax=Coemansia brasiliensis TaxID=2650707 RepID=A0A9W8I7W9_9FUNG|nr:hypothetical protein IWW36_005353 [Coemansia brasiliensis]
MPPIPTIELGTAGNKIRVSHIGLGIMGMSQVYGKTNDEESIKLLNHAIDIGCTFWDTSDIYGLGHNERLISRVLKGRRKDVFLCINLERLGTDYIDLYYQHRMDPKVPIEETMGALTELVKKGKIRYIGLSECTPEELRWAHKVHPVVAVQVEYSPWSTHIETNGVLDTCRELNVTVVAYSPLGRGFMSGKIRSIDDLDENGWRRNSPRFKPEHFENNLKLVDAFAKFAKKHDCTSSQLALAWLLIQEENLIVIPGTKQVKYLEDNFSAGNMKLSNEEIMKIREIVDSANIQGTRY